MSLRTTLAVLVAALIAMTGFATSTAAADDSPRTQAAADDRPLVIGHRGASGYRPEHTLASYALAARQGADYIEPDLVITKDGVLVARHEPEIGGTTDVADRPEFADRKTTKSVDGNEVTGWFAEDFTYAELQTLRAKERIPNLRPGNTAFDGYYRIPTFQQVIDLSKRLSRELGRPIGIYPETKHPTYFRAQGLPLEGRLIAALVRNGLNRRGAKVFVQSFETTNLKALSKVLRVPLIQLYDSPDLVPFDLKTQGKKTTYGDLATAKGLKSVAQYADGVGPWFPYIIPLKEDGSSGEPTSFVDDAHRVGLDVHPYTLRRENSFLPKEFKSSDDAAGIGDLVGWTRRFIDAGVDGYFTDNPDLGKLARDGEKEGYDGT